MRGRRTPVLAVSGDLIVHYRSLSEAAEAAGVSKVEIYRAIRGDRRINGVSYDYDLDAGYFQDLEEQDV
jgi:hypothetical protein